MNDISKLPKWAQEAFAQIRMEKDNAVEALTRYTDNQTESPVFLFELQHLQKNKPEFIKNYIQTDRVCFDLAGDEVQARLVDGKLEIYARSGTLVVRPTATNMITIETESY